MGKLSLKIIKNHIKIGKGPCKIFCKKTMFKVPYVKKQTINPYLNVSFKPNF